ncbi:hypothetical protein ACFE04_005098 [Oxalis oulophora]
MEAPVPYILTATSSSTSGGALDDTLDDGCSICLELFTSQNPATVTCCKHEYHLQCILDWSQRSKECPICWQSLVLKDAASQELLIAVACERQLRTRNVSLAEFRTPQSFHEDFDAEEEASFSDDSDFDEQVMQQLAFAASRARYDQRSERHRSSEHCPSQFLLFTSPSSVRDMTSQGEGPRLSHRSSDGHSPTSGMLSAAPLFANSDSRGAVSGDTSFKPSGELPPPSPLNSSPPETFSESVKSRWSAASARCKESFSKGTRGIKEMSKGVHREMSAGVSRMIEKLDLTSKRTGPSVPISGLGTSNFFFKGKGVQENTIVHSVNTSSVSNAMASKLEISHAKFHTKSLIFVALIDLRNKFHEDEKKKKKSVLVNVFMFAWLLKICDARDV